MTDFFFVFFCYYLGYITRAEKSKTSFFLNWYFYHQEDEQQQDDSQLYTAVSADFFPFKNKQSTVASHKKMLDFPDKSETRNKMRYRISGRFFKHFSNNSSIHGLKFITQDGVSWFERLVIFLGFVWHWWWGCTYVSYRPPSINSFNRFKFSLQQNHVDFRLFVWNTLHFLFLLENLAQVWKLVRFYIAWLPPIPIEWQSISGCDHLQRQQSIREKITLCALRSKVFNIIQIDKYVQV